MEKNNPLSFDPIRVKVLREARGLSQRDVAALLGISQSSYNDIECGRSKLKAETVPRLATYLEVDVRYFFQRGISIAEKFNGQEEKDSMHNKCSRLKYENKILVRKLSEYEIQLSEHKQLLSEQKQIYIDYRKQSESLLMNMCDRLKTKTFYINVLLFFSLMILFVFSLVSVLHI